MPPLFQKLHIWPWVGPDRRRAFSFGKLGVIPLTNGYAALCDAEDVPLVAMTAWQASMDRNGLVYARSTKNGVPNYAMHVAIFGAVPEGMGVDHRNGDPLDNRRSNLRAATPAQQGANRRMPKRGGRYGSQFRGVGRSKNGTTWQAKLMVNRKRHHVNCPTEIDAARAYDALAREFHGEFAVLNFPNGTDASRAHGSAA